MLDIQYEDDFLRKVSKVKDNSIKERVKTQIRKIIANPEVGKPMRHDRKGTRELYISPFRLSYAYVPEENKIIILDLYHKDEQ